MPRTKCWLSLVFFVMSVLPDVRWYLTEAHTFLFPGKDYSLEGLSSLPGLGATFVLSYECRKVTLLFVAGNSSRKSRQKTPESGVSPVCDNHRPSWNLLRGKGPEMREGALSSPDSRPALSVVQGHHHNLNSALFCSLSPIFPARSSVEMDKRRI